MESSVEADQTIAQIHKDVKDSLQLDARLRDVEIRQGEMGAIVAQLDKALPAMEQRLVREIQDSRPKNVPAYVAVAVAALSVVLSPILAAVMQR